MKKKDLIRSVSKETGYTQGEIGVVLESLLGKIATALSEQDKVMLNNFGTFSIRERASREARNPITGEMYIIGKRYAVHFTPSQKLKDCVKEGAET